MAKNDLKILVAHGVNLDLLGTREPDIYGTKTLKDIEALLQNSVAALAQIAGVGSASLDFYQSNVEADFLAKLSPDYDGAVINPGAWTHTSLALADRLAGIDLPFAEVHLSNLHKRESVRQQSLCGPHAVGVVEGFGIDSYVAGLLALLMYLKNLNW